MTEEVWTGYDYENPPVKGAVLTDRGWELPLKGTDPTKELTELIVAFAKDNPTSTVAAEANIVAVYVLPKENDYQQGDTLQVAVAFNEFVDAAAGATLSVTSTGATASFNLTAAAQNEVGEVLFEGTIPNETADLTIDAQTLGGTITDSTDGTASDLQITSDVAADTELIAIA